jgi:replication factor C subunit 3/5
MLFYGPSGSGKKTRVMAMLRAIYGPGAERVRLEHRPFKTPSGRAIEMTTVASNFHIEINPGDAGIYDRYVVQEVIKEMAAYSPLGEGARPFKVVILSEVDRMTKEAQAALRRTMEKYSSTCRLILVCSSPSKVIEPVRSRCLGVRVPLPSPADLMRVLQAVATKEGITLPTAFAAKLSQASGRNVRRAVLLLEAAKVQGYPFTEASRVPLMDWERYVEVLSRDIVKEQSPKSLIACRAKIYELLVNCIPADALIRKLLACLLEKVKCDPAKHELAAWAAAYEHRLQLGQKEVFHIEAFCARAMQVLKVTNGAL